MNPRSSFQVRLACVLLVGCSMLGAMTATSRASGQFFKRQKQDKTKTAASASRVNAEYTAKIKEYTTEKYFLTELVDHLPA
ncbi:MAG TPA: hypothetical protein VNS63_10890, partial [Blastocatellia bacterium]|nr:hypothetical protein [Blastocatellia bacterium]